MPTTQHNSKAINARRFAALFAGFDTGNASDEEALSKGRALRRMAADNNLRIVDLLEMPEIRQAIDDQMQPLRKNGRDLETAMEQAAALREELTERTRNVRALAEMLTREKETTEALRRQLATPTGGQGHGQTRNQQQTRTTAPAGASNNASQDPGMLNVVMKFVALWLVIGLMMMAAIR